MGNIWISGNLPHKPVNGVSQIFWQSLQLDGFFLYTPDVNCTKMWAPALKGPSRSLGTRLWPQKRRHGLVALGRDSGHTEWGLVRRFSATRHCSVRICLKVANNVLFYWILSCSAWFSRIFIQIPSGFIRISFRNPKNLRRTACCLPPPFSCSCSLV